MKANFVIKSMTEIEVGNNFLDLHNNFDVVNFDYSFASSVFIVNFIKSPGDWAKSEKIARLQFIHEDVSFLKIIPGRENAAQGDKCCLGEITFFPSGSREINDSINLQESPEPGDDIIYYYH